MNEDMEQPITFENVSNYFKTASICEFIEKYGEVLKASKYMNFGNEFSTLLYSYRNSTRDYTVNEEFAKLFKEFSKKSDLIEEIIDYFEYIKDLAIRILSYPIYLGMIDEFDAESVVLSAKHIYLFDSIIPNSFAYKVLMLHLDSIEISCSKLIRKFPETKGKQKLILIIRLFTC